MTSPAENENAVPCVRQEQGFLIYTLANERVEISVIPELGARVTSLKNQRTGRQWMWHPPGPLKLFRNRPHDDFSNSPLAGADECFPSIAPCRWQGRQIPDHGEAWSAAWTLNDVAWKHGAIQTRVTLPISPFTLERSIQLRGNEILLDYRLHHRGAASERFLWAWHPLLKLHPGDNLVLPASTRETLPNAAWLDDIHSAARDGDCSKMIAWPVTDGSAAIRNSATGDSLSFKWSPDQNQALGLWLNRGGWHGHHHFALEPANGDADDLSQCAARDRCGSLDAGQSTAWQVRLAIGP